VTLSIKSGQFFLNCLTFLDFYLPLHLTLNFIQNAVQGIAEFHVIILSLKSSQSSFFAFNSIQAVRMDAQLSFIRRSLEAAVNSASQSQIMRLDPPVTVSWASYYIPIFLSCLFGVCTIVLGAWAYFLKRDIRVGGWHKGSDLFQYPSLKQG
jgi:hypothetical protein